MLPKSSRLLPPKGNLKEKWADLTVKVSLNADTITISDRGIGLTAEEIEKYINQIAFLAPMIFLKNTKMTPMPLSVTSD